MILGSASPAFAAGEMSVIEVAASMEVSVSDSQNKAEEEQSVQDDSDVKPEQESADSQGAGEEGDSVKEAGLEECGLEEDRLEESGSEEAGIVEDDSDEDSKAAEKEDLTNESKTDSVGVKEEEEEEEKPEILVGAEENRVSVGENVTAEFDSATGTVTFYSKGGTLDSEWSDKLGIGWSKRDFVKFITISDDSDVMYLPGACDFLFYGYKNLQSLDLSKADTSKVYSMYWMFWNCSSLQNLDLESFDTSNVTCMEDMFCKCSSLQALDLSGFDTSNVTNMWEMFSGCSSLRTLDISGFNTSKVKDMAYLFSGCSSLQRLDLSSFEINSIYNKSGIIDIGSDSELLVILTPVNVQETIDLPYTFVDASGTEYNTIPTGLSESIRLTKKDAGVPTDLEILGLSDDFYGMEGMQASFHINVQGSGAVSYQWQYKLAGPNQWITPGQASAKTADYTFKLCPSYNNMKVRCIVSDEYGLEVISRTRNVNVFIMTSQPADAVVGDGQAVTFDVASTAQGPTYQWYFMRPNDSWRKVTVKGYNTSSLPITGAEKNNGTSYRCVITDRLGNRITSSSAKITVIETLQIVNLSEDFYGKAGTNALFHIEAYGKGNLSYQWQYKLAGQSNWRTPPQESAKTPDYVFKLRNSYDNIEVRCIVTNDEGDTCISDIRKANVFGITEQPDTVYTELGKKVTFAVEGIGQNLTYQWYFRRLDGGWKMVTVAGYNTASLTLTAKVKNNGTQYRCYVYDGLGNLIKSQAAMLVVRNEEYLG